MKKRMVRWMGVLALGLGLCWTTGCQATMPDKQERQATMPDAQERETIMQTLRQFNERGAYADGYAYLKSLTVMSRNRGFLEEQLAVQCVAWAEARMGELMAQARARLLKKDLAGARSYVYGFGVVGVPEVDKAVAVVKVRVLNSWINPRACDEIVARASSTFNGLVMKGDLDGAEACLRAERRPAVVAYVHTVDQSLADIAQETKRLDVPEASGAALAANRRTAFQNYFGCRAGDFLPFEPEEDAGKKERDYARLQALLSVLNERLRSQDMSAKVADVVCASLEAEVRALVAAAQAPRASARNMTTQQLNERIHAWYGDAWKLLGEMRRLEQEMARQKRARQLVEAELQKKFQKMLARQAALAALGPFDPDVGVGAFEAAIRTATPALARIYGDAARALRLLKRDAPLGDAEKAALLVGAACLDRDGLVRRALALGASPDAASRLDGDRIPALTWAVRMGSEASFAELLACNAKPDAADARGRTALMEAVDAGRSRLARTLLERRARVDARDAQGRTALHLAAGRGDTGAMRMLLEAGAPIDALDEGKESPCAAALKANRLNAVRLLVAAKCNLSAVSNALDLAVQTRDVETVKYVVATWKVSDAAVLTRGVARAAREGACACARHLAEAGGAVEDVHLDLAVRSGSLEAVRFFVERGCDVQKVRATATPEVAAYLKSQGRQ